MHVELSHHDATRLFPALIDEELAEQDEARLRQHLDGCGECREGWVRYERTVTRVRSVGRERAPAGLASLIVRRVRRRRSFGLRSLVLAQAHYRVPFEVIIPLLLGVLVATVLLLAS